jgi:choline dehydrogenase
MTTRILWDGRKAMGVEFKQHGETRKVMVAARGDPRRGRGGIAQAARDLGVGQGALLQELGIKLVHESPMVGENMQDHYMIGCQAALKEPHHSINQLSRGVKLLGEIAKYGLTRKGLLSYAVAHGCAFVKSRDELAFPRHPDPRDGRVDGPRVPQPVPGPAARQGPGHGLEPVPGAPGIARAYPCQVARRHRVAEDRAELPQRPDRQQSVVDQLKIIRKIWQQPALQPYLKAPGDPFGETDEDMLGYAKVAGGTLYHAVGTVAMGDERYPLDPQLRCAGSRACA